jgi:hypothetical protein
VPAVIGVQSEKWGWWLRVGKAALDVGIVMVDSDIVLILKTLRGVFLSATDMAVCLMLNSEAFVNLSITFQEQAKLSFDLFPGFTVASAPVNSGLLKSHAIRRSRCVFF